MSVPAPVTLAAALLAAACFGGTPDPAPRPSFDDTITSEELAAVDHRTLYDAIRALRPGWLQVRGGFRSVALPTDVYVFQNTALLGTTEILRLMGTEGVSSIRHVSGSAAKASLPGLAGTYVDGAIIVWMRARPPA